MEKTIHSLYNVANLRKFSQILKYGNDLINDFVFSPLEMMDSWLIKLLLENIGAEQDLNKYLFQK